MPVSFIDLVPQCPFPSYAAGLQSSDEKRETYPPPELGDSFLAKDPSSAVERIPVRRARLKRLHARFDDAGSGEAMRGGVGGVERERKGRSETRD